MKSRHLLSIGTVVAVAIVLAAPAAGARDLGVGDDRLCEEPVDANCQDYDVECDPGDYYEENCYRVGNGHWCAAFTTMAPDSTIPEHVGPVCRHETYGEPPY